MGKEKEFEWVNPGVEYYLKGWLNPPTPITNIDRIYHPELIDELLELKEKKNENIKEATETTQE